MSNIIITGGAGFIGSNLIDKLLESGQYKITCIDNFDPFYASDTKKKNIEAALKNDEEGSGEEIDIPPPSSSSMLEDLDTGDLISPAEEGSAEEVLEEDASADRIDQPGELSSDMAEFLEPSDPDDFEEMEQTEDLLEQPSIASNDKEPTSSKPIIDTGKQTTTSIEDTDMTNIQKILAEFTNIEGVHTACLVGRDGFLLDNIARSGIDAEMIGAIASSGFGSAESMGNQLGQGDLNMTMLEYTDGPVMFAPVGVEAFLVIVADKDTNLGWIRLTIKKNSKLIEQAASF